VGVATAILDLLLPPRCVACGAADALLCEECRAQLVLLHGTVCARCGCPTAWPVERCSECAGRRLSFASARAAAAYDGPARALVAAWKERGVRRLAALAAELVVDVVPRPSADGLAFVPGEPDRVGWRGANAAEQLARALGCRWELPVQSLLERTRRAKRQRGLSRTERRTNVRGAFRAAMPVPASIVLVDDVYTTGATALAASTELRRAGAKVVHVVTFARVVRR
jgi:predicted amidophosphoribosyltransferase